MVLPGEKVIMGREIEPKRMGRPSTYTEEVGERICQRLGEGELAWDICKDLGVPWGTLFEWKARIPQFADMYAAAREAYAEKVAGELMGIAANEPDVNRARLMVDTRKWIASKQLPKVYGDRQVQEISGPDGGPIEVGPARVEMDKRAILCAAEEIRREESKALRAREGQVQGNLAVQNEVKE